jgi:hypothetical protein
MLSKRWSKAILLSTDWWKFWNLMKFLKVLKFLMNFLKFWKILKFWNLWPNIPHARCTHSEVQLGKCQSEKREIPYYWIYGILTLLPMVYRPPTHGISNPLPMVFCPPTHGISTPLPMVFWPLYPWYIDPHTHAGMVYWPPYAWYIDPPIHGILTPLPWNIDPLCMLFWPPFLSVN